MWRDKPNKRCQSHKEKRYKECDPKGCLIVALHPGSKKLTHCFACLSQMDLNLDGY
jgi:hypothetical protein